MIQPRESSNSSLRCEPFRWFFTFAKEALKYADVINKTKLQIMEANIWIINNVTMEKINISSMPPFKLVKC